MGVGGFVARRDKQAHQMTSKLIQQFEIRIYGL